MTCPITPTTTSHEHPRGATPPVTGAIDFFERVAGSTFIAFYAAALFDQAMVPGVSAALEATGRVRYTPWQRALRTAASDQLVFAGTAADREAESRRLLDLHRDVRGTGADGERYSALSPDLWNWILISTFFMHRNAAEALAGRTFTEAENQAVWDRFREVVAGLQLPGRGRLMESFDELTVYYDRFAADRLTVTPTLRAVVASQRRIPRPDFLPAAVGPLWSVVTPVAGHVTGILGYGTMRPSAREVLPMRWTRRHDVEYAAFNAVLRVAFRLLPSVVTETPLVRARKKYDRLADSYRSIGLTSFRLDPPTDAVSASGSDAVATQPVIGPRAAS
ncbi:hypothetical protein GOARA_061_01320 [Gordonia araii NBRC 100433]|uniref:ER-bound oxygenase mpaB/mpaB'/Rubber oxygenase catalytic domain-containing protein n=1 Tax=Gordonia araii NBRC 100433 TaxID=1073574 RepID=G7H4B7_9ACTN|nr:oxygenase MpaB family protein [Gordonia araii]NNG96250.1 DUF2236 domain-containing protein [Gordonia araii NBRC 100433]GAB10692.1 hypothetical protein GOARA_061_01320 [Gordonia araii NBRC 100433]